MPSVPLNMPKMSMTMDEGTIVEWLMAEGDAVTNGDIVAIVTTDKVDMEVEATADGTIEKLLYPVGSVIAVGEPIATILSDTDDLLGDLLTPHPSPTGTADSAAADPAAADSAAADSAAADSAAEDSAAADPASARPGDTQQGGTQQGGTQATPAVAASPGQVPAAPLARKLAREAGIDLHTVAPTGARGIIRAQDVRSAVASGSAAAGTAVAAASAPAATASVPAAPVVAGESAGAILGDARVRRMRLATANVMSHSAAIPQFTVQRTLDLGHAARARSGALRGVGWTTILLRAYAMALREFASLNGSWTAAGVRPNKHVGIALAVDAPTGLIAPTLLDPDQLPIRELDTAVRQLVNDAHTGGLSPDAMRGASGTLSNLGGLNVTRFNALLTPPQTTALSVGTVDYRPMVASDGTFVAMLGCDVGLTIDHRAADGADGARALQYVQEIVSDPLRLAV